MRRERTYTMAIVLAATLCSGAASGPVWAAESQLAAESVSRNSVGSKEIIDGAVRPRDLSPGAKPAGVSFAEADEFVEIGQTIKSVVSTVLVAPSNGFVVVSATWSYSGEGFAVGVCTINKKAGLEAGPYALTQIEEEREFVDSMALTRTKSVSAGSNTFHLNCQEKQTGRIATIISATINAVFYPERY